MDDDTAHACAIAEVAATGADLRSGEALTAIARRFADWDADGPADVGIQTSAVLSLVGRTPTAAEMSAVARRVHERHGRSVGNGSLMRTGAVALAHPHDPTALVDAAMSVSALTHHSVKRRDLGLSPVAGFARHSDKKNVTRQSLPLRTLDSI